MKKYRMMNRSDTLLHFAIKGKYSHYSLWANLRIMKYNAKYLKKYTKIKDMRNSIAPITIYDPLWGLAHIRSMSDLKHSSCDTINIFAINHFSLRTISTFKKATPISQIGRL